MKIERVELVAVSPDHIGNLKRRSVAMQRHEDPVRRQREEALLEPRAQRLRLVLAALVVLQAPDSLQRGAEDFEHRPGQHHENAERDHHLYKGEAASGVGMARVHGW